MHNALVSDHHILAMCHSPTTSDEMEKNIAALCSTLHYAHKLVPDAGFDMIADQVSPMVYAGAVVDRNVSCSNCGATL